MQSSLSCKPYISLYASTYLKERGKKKLASSQITYPHCCQYSIFCPDFRLLFHFFLGLPRGHRNLTRWLAKLLKWQRLLFSLFIVFSYYYPPTQIGGALALLKKAHLQMLRENLSGELLCSFRSSETTLCEDRCLYS